MKRLYSVIGFLRNCRDSRAVWSPFLRRPLADAGNGFCVFMVANRVPIQERNQQGEASAAKENAPGIASELGRTVRRRVDADLVEQAAKVIRFGDHLDPCELTLRLNR